MELGRGLQLARFAASSCPVHKPSICSSLRAKNSSMHSSLQLQDGVSVLHGFGNLAESTRYKVWLLDQFGVLHDGQKPYPGAVETLHRVAEAGAKLVILSNSSRRAASTYERIERLGFDASLFTGIITSGELTHQYLLQRKDPWFAALGGKCVHITWNARSAISLEGLGLEIVEDPGLADFLLVHGTEAWGLRDGGIKPATLSELENVLNLASRRGLPMVVANPDHVTVEARDLMIMPGSLGLQYEKLGGYVRYMGKPDTVVYEAAMEMTGHKSCDMLAVGDSLFHDIQGAARNQIDSVFVAGGIHADELGIRNVGDQPNLDNLQSLLRTKGFYPTYVVPMFSW